MQTPQAQEACLGRRTVWGQASKIHPGSQSLIGGSLRRPAKVSEPYWGKPQDAILGPGAFLGQASGSQPASQSLIGGSLKKPPCVPEPYWGKPPASGGQPVSQSLPQRLFVGSGGCLGRRWPKMAPRRPKTAQAGPKMASRDPGWPQGQLTC